MHPAFVPDGQLLSVKEVAKRLGVSYSDATRRVRRGEIGSTRLGDSPKAPYRVSERDLNVYLSRCYRPGL